MTHVGGRVRSEFMKTNKHTHTHKAARQPVYFNFVRVGIICELPPQSNQPRVAYFQYLLDAPFRPPNCATILVVVVIVVVAVVVVVVVVVIVDGSCNSVPVLGKQRANASAK